MLSPSSHRRAWPPAHRTPRTPRGLSRGRGLRRAQRMARSAARARARTAPHPSCRRTPLPARPPAAGGARGGVPARRRRRASRSQGGDPPPNPNPPPPPHAPPPLKAENIVFAAKGSPLIKFIDFGGACTWTQQEGLTGLVGTPQYVAPEVVTGYGEDKPTEAPYGKGCVAPEQGLGGAGVRACVGPTLRKGCLPLGAILPTTALSLSCSASPSPRQVRHVVHRRAALRDALEDDALPRQGSRPAPQAGAPSHTPSHTRPHTHALTHALTRTPVARPRHTSPRAPPPTLTRWSRASSPSSPRTGGAMSPHRPRT